MFCAVSAVSKLVQKIWTEFHLSLAFPAPSKNNPKSFSSVLMDLPSAFKTIGLENDVWDMGQGFSSALWLVLWVHAIWLEWTCDEQRRSFQKSREHQIHADELETLAMMVHMDEEGTEKV